MRRAFLMALFGVVVTVVLPSWVSAQARVLDDPKPESLLSPAGLVHLLGGVEVTGGLGLSSASSTVERGSEDSLEVASGSTTESVFGVALYSGPLETGFNLKPSAGFLTHNITISDFDQDVADSPDLDNDEDDAIEIGGMCTRFEDGAAVDCRSQNVYTLTMRSLYAGVQGGYDHVFGSGAVRFFLGISGNLSLIEYRLVDVTFNDQTSTSTGVSFISSGGFNLTAGLAFPSVRLTLRLLVSTQLYNSFEYEERLEFQGPLTFDTSRDTYLRPRMFVKDTSLSLTNYQLAAGYLF